ncbi:mannosyl-oligosaccharide 1,2-alpha-mannosidase MNS3-like [Bidens hawaiensis]|uniref:mannosyl-oligosaccharide 1,2-alpha-mannosidase MNS3-like n=1 Tax=Bidens hawaiensis TaxID=980011 RepID=UPI00404B4E99
MTVILAVVSFLYASPSSSEFSGDNIRLGSRGDSYDEYLIKVWLQQRDSNWTYWHDMYVEAMKGVKHLLVKKSNPNGLVFVGELPSGIDGDFSPKMDHLVCFLPGTLALGATKGKTKAKAKEENLLTFEDLENLKLAEDLAKTCFEMYAVTSTGLAPEIAYFNSEGYSEEHLDGGNKTSEYIHDIVIKRADRHNLLRPETVESLFILYRITEDSKYREWGWSIFKAFEKYTKVLWTTSPYFLPEEETKWRRFSWKLTLYLLFQNTKRNNSLSSFNTEKSSTLYEDP